MILGPDESLTTSAEAFAREAYDRTLDYWQSWSRSLSIPFEWQDAVIRAAITLKLCQYEGTGAIVAALTTSIPEAPGHRAQLGLPLLLAARRRLRRANPQPARGDQEHGGLPRLHLHPGVGDSSRCSRSTASTSSAH